MKKAPITYLGLTTGTVLGMIFSRVTIVSLVLLMLFWLGFVATLDVKGGEEKK